MAGVRAEHAARVHPIVGIECVFDGAHQAQGHGAFAPLQFLALENANAVLGRDAAAGADDHPSAARTQRLARVIGDRWNSAVVAAAFRGTRLFARFQEDLQIGPAQLSDRLTELQDLGILRTRAYAGTRQEYRLTRAGLALFPLTLEMVRWGNRWLSSEAADPLAVRHLPCGHLLAARWHCDHCAQEIVRESVRFG